MGDKELAQRVADGLITETTRKQYADRVRFHIVPLIGGVRLRHLSAMHIRQWQAMLAQQGASPSLRRRALAILKTALERAVRYELIPANPAQLTVPVTSAVLPSHHMKTGSDDQYEARTVIVPS